MKINNVNSILSKEMRKAVSAILETKLSSSSDEEKKRQDRMAQAVKARGAIADSDDKKIEEQEDTEKDSKSSKDSKEKKSEKQKDRTGGKGTADSNKLKEPKKETLKAPTIGSIVDKLNALRGGKSLKDPSVKDSFAQYFEGLTTVERQTLLAFLTGIAQILAGTKEGTDALEPSDIGVKTEPTKDRQQDEELKDVPKTGSEENPIIVGENANYDVVKALKAYRNIDATS